MTHLFGVIRLWLLNFVWAILPPVSACLRLAQRSPVYRARRPHVILPATAIFDYISFPTSTDYIDAVVNWETWISLDKFCHPLSTYQQQTAETFETAGSVAGSWPTRKNKCSPSHETIPMVSNWHQPEHALLVKYECYTDISNQERLVRVRLRIVSDILTTQQLSTPARCYILSS